MKTICCLEGYKTSRQLTVLIDGNMKIMNVNKLLKNICEYPYQLDNINKSVSPMKRHKMRMRRTTRDREVTPCRFKKLRPKWDDSLLPDVKKKPVKKLPKIKLLFQKKAQLNDDTLYNIKIQKNKRNKHIYLIAENNSTSAKNDDYYVDLPSKEAK